MDKYTVISLIGEGSFGRVYKATKKLDDGIVAIKIISKRGRSSKELKNLRRECEIQANLKHPNVIEMFESFETKNELVVVTEFALIDLHRFLGKNGPISEEKSQKLTGHLVSALYYLHSHRILHRDLKPQNVLLNEVLHAKLCDFGLARSMTMGTHVLTSIKGTPLYMAPELLAEKPYDHQADLWSLGCIAYETMAGQTPFNTTSILHLVRLIRHEEIKWPSFLSSDCQSFLQGLLEKDPSLRMTWAQILCHPYIEKYLMIAGVASENSPFINPKSKTKQNVDKNRKLSVTENLTYDDTQKLIDIDDSIDNITSSRDSIKAILQSDIENIETDAEDTDNQVVVPFSETPSRFDMPASRPIINDPFKPPDQGRICYVSGNPNLVVNHFNDNFKLDHSSEISKMMSKLNIGKTSTSSMSDKAARNKDLEKRKLSQNLDNFSLRLGQSIDIEGNKKVVESVSEKKKVAKSQSSGNEDKIGTENTPPCLLPGWDSCDDSQSPPIENEEWLAFLYRSMQEIIDGELDALKQQNLVSIIVAPLRNSKASPKVIECVGQLLSLPLVLDGSGEAFEIVRSVYVEVKLVPNLMYASKLLTSSKSVTDSASSPLPGSTNRSFRSVAELSSNEIKTICRLYELICHLVHLNEQFLLQFCDAVAILAADELLINFLTHDFKDANAVRIANCIVALLCCVVRELPENAELVERIVFNHKLDLVSLMKIKNALMRTRMCMLFRLLGRFSLRGLQTIWTANIRETIEALTHDSSDQVRSEAESALAELKQFSFYL